MMDELPRLRRWLYLSNSVLIVVVLGTLIYLTASVLEASNDVQHFTEQQVEIIQDQNDLQLCTQHDITIAIRKIGRKLGLPVDDITVPHVEEIDCASLQSP